MFTTASNVLRRGIHRPHTHTTPFMASTKRISPSFPVNNGVRTLSAWANVPMGPPDPILGLNEAFKKDESPNKVNLGVGAYRDEAGNPYVLETVQEAQRRIVDRKMDHEYAPIAGVPGFAELAAEFMYGHQSPALQENRVASVQALSGTGALRVMGSFLKEFLANGEAKPIYLPNPTWGNHNKVFTAAGLVPKQYRYYDRENIGLDFEGMYEDIASAEEGSFVLLHACAHNPTGIDPTREQWSRLSQLMKKKNHIVLFDSAYQGFASGNATEDAHAVRKFVEDGHCLMLAQSFAKNFGLYGERVGALSVVCDKPEEKERVLSQLKILIRAMYSNPPIHGARIVKEILGDEELREKWNGECKGMADRINGMRQSLREELEKRNAGDRPWNHITDQIGMFCFSGLTEEQVSRMIQDQHVYMTKDGRISMAGITPSNVSYVAESIAKVLK
eukprot:gb/GECG01015282.1/.p1 GENE.gb/GECG01015282.1/~~gb/GECG01015282.1/.p1  ORF type:complete len:447 (+),score=47.27 gb/GECG01015282.1/:1-1341(+)